MKLIRWMCVALALAATAAGQFYFGSADRVSEGSGRNGWGSALRRGRI